MERKPHWERLQRIIEQEQNCEIVIKCQDGVPVYIVKIRNGEREGIDLTKE